MTACWAGNWGSYIVFKKPELLKNAVQQLFRSFTKPDSYLAQFNNHFSKKSITEREAELQKLQQTKETRST